MDKLSPFILFAISLCIVSCAGSKEQAGEDPEPGFVVIGYVPGYDGVIDETTIDADKLTHINYAFVNVKDSLASLTNIETDTVNFRRLNNLKKINPSLKILISLGGWSWSENFSDAVLTESSRRKFAQSNASI